MRSASSAALTGACFLELEAQPPELGVDFFNTFQETSRHFRQKWFEVADFCIFNVGGVGTLEEIGIELCNLKLGIRPRVPFVFYDSAYFADLRAQILEMIAAGLSNREIAERGHVSENTVKTHSSRVFSKLGARRRTQAVQLGKEMRLIP